MKHLYNIVLLVFISSNVYAITADTLTQFIVNPGVLTSSKASFSSARDTVSADVIINSYYIGAVSTSVYYLRRSQTAVKPTLPANTVIDSAYYLFTDINDVSTTNFGIIVVSSTSDTTVTTSSYNDFIGWSASGAYTGIKPLNKLCNTSSISGSTLKIYLNQAGTDSILAHNNGIFKTTFIASFDSANTDIGTSFTGYINGARTDIKLIIFYHPPVVLSADSLHFSLLTDTTAKLLNISLPTGADTTNKNKYSILYKSNGYYIQPQDTSGNPFKKTETKFTYSTLKNIVFPLVKNYYHAFEIRSWSLNGLDSLKTCADTLTLGTPATGGDTVTVTIHDTTEVYYYIHDTVTIVIDTMFVLQSAAVYDLISDSIGLARLEWRSDISESLATVQPESLAYANLTGLDSAEFYVMGYDSTTGGTVLRKLKELLSYIGL